MKKLLSIMLIAVLAVSSVFAVSGYIGTSSGYSFDYAKVSDDKISQVATSIPVNIDGATFFGKGSFNFGLSYGGKMASIPMNYYVGDVKFDSDPSKYTWTLAPYAGLTFQYRFSKGFGIAGSVNATYNWGSAKDEASQYLPSEVIDLIGKFGVDVKYHILGAMGNLYLNMNLGSFNIRIGASMEGPIGTWAQYELLNATTTSDMIDSMGPFSIVPFAGIGFAY